MDNIDRALAVLEAARRPGEIRIHPYDAVEALAKAGLISPYLPEPSYVVTECEYEYPVWECSGRYSIEEETPGYITIFDEGEPAESLTLQEARQIGLALLAAAQHAEES